jgi:hypothetical protein
VVSTTSELHGLDSIDSINLDYNTYINSITNLVSQKENHPLKKRMKIKRYPVLGISILKGRRRINSRIYFKKKNRRPK